MKKHLYALLLAGVFGLSGCTAEVQPDMDSVSEQEQVTEKVTETQPELPDYSHFDIGGTMPVISIETVNQAENALDFVTKPVNQFVAESIRSWTPGYQMPPAPYYETCSVTVTGADNAVQLDAADAQVKVRGNWTTSYDKKPLRIKFTQPQNLLGMNDGADAKNWVLLAGYKDASLLRDKTVLEIAGELLEPDGLYASDAEFVEVEINGQYWGVYLLAEYQQINADRVNITEAAKDYTGTDIGYFLEFDGYFTNEGEMQSFMIDYADNAPLTPYDGKEGRRTVTVCSESRRDGKQDVGYTIKSDIYSQEQHDFIAAYVDAVYDILYAAAYEDTAYVFNAETLSIEQADDLTPQEAVEAVVDTKSLADAYILNELACDADIYWSSFFMSADFGENGDGRLTFHAPWDFDSALGNKDRCADAQGYYAANIVHDVNDMYETINPWLAVLMHEEWFQAYIREAWTEAYDNGVFDRAIAMIAEDTAQYQEAFTRNYDRWDNIRNNSAKSELCRRAAQCRTQEEASAWLSEWLTARVEFLNTCWHEQ